MIDKPIYVQTDEMEVADDTTTISNPELAQAVKEHPDEAADFLSEKVVPVDLDEISIDESGRVVVRDPAFAKAIAERSAASETRRGLAAPNVKNGVCGAGC
jgi:hypothetical protein